MEPSEHEKYVRERWEAIRSFWCASKSWHICDGTEEMEVWRDTEVEAWSAAYAFTLERERQIAEVQKQMAWIMSIETVDTPQDEYLGVMCRLQDALDNLKRGMKVAEQERTGR